MITITLVRDTMGRLVGRTFSDRWNLETIGADVNDLPGFKVVASELGFKVRTITKGVQSTMVGPQTDSEFQAMLPEPPASWYAAWVA